MSIHEFRVGDTVVLRPQAHLYDETTYEITRVMPSEGPEPSYRLKAVNSSRERVASEHELQLTSGGDVPSKPAEKLPRREGRRHRRQDT